MTIELEMLLWSVALTFMQMIVAGGGTIGHVDRATLAGNREHMPAVPGWGGRGRRGHANMLESLGVFTALVLIATLAGRTNATTARGAEMFFWARLVYAGVYMAGIPYLRTLVWFVSIIGLALIFVQFV